MIEKIIPLKKQGSQNLALGVLSLTTAHNREWQLDEVRIHFSGVVTQTVTVSTDDIAGANYDTVIKTQSLSGAADFSWIPGEKIVLHKGDEIKVACTNNATPAIICYATIVGHEI